MACQDRRYSSGNLIGTGIIQKKVRTVFKDWRTVLGETDVDCKTEEYQRQVVDAIEACFPLKKMRRKDTDPPWINKQVWKEISSRKKFFQEEGGIRTQAWKR